MSNTTPAQANCHTWCSEEFWNNDRAESLVITSLNTVPGALLTLGNVPGFPSTAQNKTTENALFIVCVNKYSWKGQLWGVPVTQRDKAPVELYVRYCKAAQFVVVCCVNVPIHTDCRSSSLSSKE